MRRQMHRGSRGSRHEKKGKKACRAKTARDRAAEGQKPYRIDGKMGPVGMEERVGDEGPYIGAAARQYARNHIRRVVTRRNKSEGQQKFQLLFFAQQQRVSMHKHEHSQHRDEY